MLTVNKLTKTFGKVAALDDVSFGLERGQVAAVIGANGAGKTTMIKCILGLLKFEGSVAIDGVDVAKKAKEARRRVGYVAQTPAFHSDLSVRETMTFYADLKGVPVQEAPALIEQVGLADQLDKSAGALSGGMRQRLALAVAMLGNPPLLVLDEPASGLDIGARIELREFVTRQREAGTSVLLSTHWMEDVPYIADTTLVLDQGKLVFSGSASALAGAEAAGSKLFLRLNGHSREAIPMISALTGREVQRSGDWVIASCPPTQKAGIVESLIASGVNILDFRVEEASVDDAVLRLRGTQGEQQ
jgi:ABC-type multidrug transport system ATPase subunit